MSFARIGLIGGTFDPVHNGHLFMAGEAAHAFSLARVYFVPAFIPPHKAAPPGAPPSDRLRMCALAADGEPAFDVSGMEIERKGKSYTIDTIREFKASLPRGCEVYFITGFDSCREFRTWKNFKSLLEECRVITAPRSLEDRMEAKKAQGEGFSYLDIPVMEISSTDIRRRVKEGRSVRYLTPPAVADYIENRKLYR